MRSTVAVSGTVPEPERRTKGWEAPQLVEARLCLRRHRRKSAGARAVSANRQVVGTALERVRTYPLPATEAKRT